MIFAITTHISETNPEIAKVILTLTKKNNGI